MLMRLADTHARWSPRPPLDKAPRWTRPPLDKAPCWTRPPLDKALGSRPGKAPIGGLHCHT